ncbi:peptidase domain-containing ABC transporter (plasmid) [Skermanella sp. TT6]|uniref:Peptidase domain-containing ABC transporter n=1 Tax=Skermanella cutis TaxID=2775420 RepID=A0ABX7BKX4_9PROT|nr:peptidase domain-containing ABC transporter [Skermanella sp. TT6]QQP93677.1 peptidase domain-containing ABC transporter [Skermanella sp. TT6]
MDTIETVRNTAALEAIRSVLQTHVLFNVLPAAEKRAIELLLEVRQVPAGKRLFTQGAAADGMYVIHDGTARLKENTGSKLVSVGLIEPGATIGQTSLLEETKWPHHVIAETPLTLVCLRADRARLLIAESRVVDEHFRRYVGLVEVGERLRALLGNATYSAEEFSDLLSKMGVKLIRAESAVFTQGDHDPRLYFIESGAVELIRAPITGDPISLSRCGRGTLIGETGALPRRSPKGAASGIQTYTARALTDVTVLVIYQQTVERILSLNPELRQRLSERARDIEQIEADEIAARRRAEGVDLRIKLAEGMSEDEFRAAKAKEAAKLAVIRQNTQADSAAACLAMVMGHYGRKFTLGQMQEVTGLNTPETNPDEIIRGAETLGFRAKGYALTYADLKGLKLPAIVGWQGYHWIVLVKAGDREVEVADPAKGLSRIKRDEFIASWTAADVAGVLDRRPDAGVLIALEPTVKFEKEEDAKSSIRHFINYIMPYKKYYGEAILAAVVINILGLASPLFVQTIVDNVVVHHDVGLLNMMLGGMVLVAVLTTAMSVVQSLLLAHTTSRLDMRLMSEFYRHVLSLPMDFFLTKNKGEILARFGENQKIRAILTGSTITVLMNTLMIVLYFLMMFAYSVPLSVIVVIFIPIYIGIVVYFTPKIKAIAQEIFITNSQSQSYLIESLNGIEALKATSNEYFARARWENAFVENVNRSFRQQKLSLMSNSLFKLATLASSIAVLWIGATQVMSGDMSIGELMGFNMLMGLVTGPVTQMVNLWNELQEVRIAIDRVGDVLNVKSEHVTVSAPDKIQTQVRNLEGEIKFEQVNFSYNTNDQKRSVMHGFDLTIHPGEHVAFVGPSGCGKSTIAKMVLGFYKPASGDLTIDGKDIRTMDLNSLRRNIGVVLQDTFIFGGTVAENIALGDPEPDMQAVQEAAKLAGSEDFIINFPLGYQTRIGEKGMGLSGGQRQRIGIARALYRRPKIMIFDEATSALDNESEARITQELKGVLVNRTSITIAHRLTTVMDSDRICFIKDGKVQEQGTHAQLTDPEFLKENGYAGLYYQLARTQFDLPALDLK